MTENKDYETQYIAPEILFSLIEADLKEGRDASFSVTGMSMWPFICNKRDQVVVTACEVSELRRGDIVLFKTSLGNYMLHRITSLKDGKMETTGDGNTFRDGEFPVDCVIAKVKTIIRKGKRIECESFRWRFIFKGWMWLFPARKYLLRTLRKISRRKAPKSHRN